MEWLISFCKSPYCSNLLFSLLHSLWQGAIIAALLYLFFRTKSPKGENARYSAGLIAMAAVVLCFLFTFSILNFKTDLTSETSAYSGAKQQLNIGAVEGPGDIVQQRSIEVQSVSEEPLTTTVSPAREADFNWKPFALTLWLAGVVIMLLRAMYLMAGGARIRSQCNALEDERILAIVESMRERMKITRKIRVVVSEKISIPGVIGFIRSVLFLPATMLGGMPADALEAILAHELAHIKRYDYLVNFCQMVVEAILFFNPAVWWISRQIRIEREVCCDHAGINAIGRRIRYAEILVGWAEKLRQPDMELSTAAMGFGSPDTHGPMAERIKRIVTTDHKPALKAPWHIAGMTLLLSFIAIGCLWMGADVTVAVAGKILSPEERVDRITEISQDYGSHVYDYGEDGKIQVSGTIKTWDGKPLPEQTDIWLTGKKGQASMGWGVHASTDGPLASTGTFNQEIDCIPFYILIRAVGYAPIKAGPFQPEQGENIEGLDYVLQKGYSATIKVIDSNNEPIEKVKITGGYKVNSHTMGGLSSGEFLVTDINGIATIDNTTNIETSLTLQADGFEPYSATDFIFKPDEIHVIQLTASKETNGEVVSKETGEPIEGANLWILGSESMLENHSYSYGKYGEPETVTGENGGFRLRKLRSNHRYVILVEAEGYMRHYLTDVTAGVENIIAELGPKKSIKGKITGDLKKLEKDENGTPVVIYTEFHQIEHYMSDYEEGQANVIIENGIGSFEVEKCPWQEVRITAGDRTVTVDVDEDDLNNVLIDLAPDVTKTREVILKFGVPEDEPDVEGKVLFNCFRTDATESDLPKSSNYYSMPAELRGIEIVDNQARTEIPAPGTYRCSIDINNGNRPVGYWFDGNITADIPDGNDPYIVEIPVFPAGAVYGAIRRPDGTIIENAQVIVKDVEKSEAAEQGYLGVYGSGLQKGLFNVTPIPLGGQYGIIAYEDNSYGVSELIEINEKNPIVNIDIDVPEGVEIHGRLVDADGNPVMGQVGIITDIERGKISHRFFGSGVWSDEDGRFVVENVNPGPYGKCLICSGGEKGYQAAVYEIKDLSEPIVIHLEKGLRATGVLIDEDTGLPIPGVEVCALRTINQNGNKIFEGLSAEALTNEKGEFVFTCMGKATYGLYVSPGESSVSCDCDLEYKITGGQEEPAVFEVSISDDGSDAPSGSPGDSIPSGIPPYPG